MRNDLSDVDRMVLSLKSVVEGKLDGAAVFRFEICASEALTNLVKHAYADETNEPILIQLRETPTSIELLVFDPTGATSFDLRDHAKDLDDVPPDAESGRGLGLILQCADVVTYGSKDGRTRLILTFEKSGVV